MEMAMAMEKQQEQEREVMIQSRALAPLSRNKENNFQARCKLLGEYLKNRILTEVGKSLKFFLITFLGYNAMQKRSL